VAIDEYSDLDALIAGVRAGRRRSLARAITLVESQRPDHQTQAEELITRLLPHAGGARRVGISGVPGSGKSTFIEALGLELLQRGSRVAVLAVDPTSRVSGGSILGDKTRMPRLSAQEACFIRPSPTAGTLGGVARRTREALLVCEAAGFDVVLVETVGVGQSEHAVFNLVDGFLLLTLAGAGDELQGIKRGILELVDVVCVNKADGDNAARAKRAAAEMQAALRLLRGTDCPRVLTTSALTGAGIDATWEALAEHHAQLQNSGQLERRRSEQNQKWLESLIDEGLIRALHAHPGAAKVHAEASQRVARGSQNPAKAARQVLDAFLGKEGRD
jgi:LAO/AO transport system kinase